MKVEVVTSSSIVQTNLTILLPVAKEATIKTFWLGVGAAAGAASPIEVTVIEPALLHCRKHGVCQPSRCTVVVGSSEPMEVDGPGARIRVLPGC